ncbi:MAG: L,D-transpeptidase, partial [Chloroflexota bacterium]|nr:L,D-transpeptidase [Chloroflexota bacterium]
IDVDLSEQYLTAYEGDEIVWEGYISSGKSSDPTPTGTYTIFSKVRVQDMSGPDPNLPGGAYFQPEVPYVMYFAGGGYAIHGVYWHSAFGSPRSHGCVGMPLGGASFLFNWATIGTTVTIHY